MQQLEIKFFYPLTEQIPLDLDYSVCEKPKLATLPITGGIFIPNDSNITYKTTFTLNDDVVIRTKKLNWLGRLIYQLMGLKWEQRID